MTQGFDGDHALDALQLRDRAAEILRGWVGLAYPSPRYIQITHPYDTPDEAARESAKQSSCGLTREALLRALGVDCPTLYQPYAPRTIGHGLPAVAMEADFARRNGAWVEASTWTPDLGLPGVCDGVLMGRNGGDPEWCRGGKNYEHIASPIDDPDGDLWSFVDGGQPGIASVRRRLVQCGTELWFAEGGSANGADGRPLVGRRVRGWSVLTAMPLAASDTDPAPAPDVLLFVPSP